MRITAAPLILWFLAAYRCHIAGCTTSRDSVAASERSSSSSKSDNAQDYDSDGDAHDDYGPDDIDDDDIDKDVGYIDCLDDAEKRFENNEKMLEDAEDIGVKEDIEEEERESEYAREKLESSKRPGGEEDSGKARIRQLMDELVAASLELRDINRELDEL
ncbi:hypothetical protein X943_000848 [Babesia divergens]|uniref:Uncharacterized protein n=1 Tax=Babesia divergens TaxID=32595 RepID=A0AAD9LIW8_BABDI|nr:hypothetical protein X943_000848 [Babesia divergens]